MMHQHRGTQFVEYTSFHKTISWYYTTTMLHFGLLRPFSSLPTAVFGPLYVIFGPVAMPTIEHIFHGIIGGSKQQLSITGSDNGLAPSRRQAIIWANDG